MPDDRIGRVATADGQHRAVPGERARLRPRRGGGPRVPAHCVFAPLVIALCACEGFDPSGLFPQPTEIGSDYGFDFLRERANVPPGAEVWIGIQKTETRSRDYSTCGDSPLSPGCGAGGKSIVPLTITGTESSYPEVADVVEIGSDGEDRILVRAYAVGGTNLTVRATADDGSGDTFSGAHNVIVRDYDDLFVFAHCGWMSRQILLPGSQSGAGRPLTTLEQMAVHEDVTPRLAAGVVGVEADGSFMAGSLSLQLSEPTMLDGQRLAPGDYSIKSPDTVATIPIEVVAADEIDGVRFIPFAPLELPETHKFGWVPATTVPLQVDKFSWPLDARGMTPILPIPMAGSRLVCPLEVGPPEGTPPPAMTSTTPSVCEVTDIFDHGVGLVAHLSAGNCEVLVERGEEVETLSWTIE